VVSGWRTAARHQKSVDVEKLAASVTDSGGVYFVPRSRLGARIGSYAANHRGLTRGSNTGTSRAALESIAFQSAELLHAMERIRTASKDCVSTRAPRPTTC